MTDASATTAPSAAPATLPRLVAIDLDGTLLGSDDAVSARSVRAVAALTERVCEVVICTGRPPRLTAAHARRAGAALAICFNGASTLDLTEDERGEDERTEHHLELGAATVAAVIATLRERAPGALLGIETRHGWYLDSPLFEQRRHHLEANGAPPPTGVGAVESFVRDRVVKVLARHPELGARDLAALLGDARSDLYLTWSGERLLEIMHPDVSKRWALARLAAERGVPRERVAAFGDQRNDLEMLRWAGFGVAMGNGSPEAKAAADAVTLGNDEDGVAVAVERWLEVCGD